MNLLRKILKLLDRPKEIVHPSCPPEPATFIQPGNNADPAYNKQSSSIRDEMVGVWESEDDGTGLHAQWGWSYKFNEDGTGMYFSWSERKLDDEIPFYWERISQNVIKARFPDDEEWDIIEYKLQFIDGVHGKTLQKLTDNRYGADEIGKEGFWGGFGALFKNPGLS